MSTTGGLSEEEVPRPAAETIILDQHDRQLAMIDGTVLWPPLDAVVELGGPNRTAIVRDVRLRLAPGHASVVVRVEDFGQIVGPLEETGISAAQAFEREGS